MTGGLLTAGYCRGGLMTGGLKSVNRLTVALAYLYQ